MQDKPKEVYTLKRNALDLRHAIAMSVAIMAPAAGIFFNTIPQAGAVGAALPLCYIIGFVVALLVASQFIEMSAELPSSGSYYTFVSQGLGPRWGFLAGWLATGAYALIAPFAMVIMSADMQDLVKRWSGLNIHWSIWFVLGTMLVGAICYRGIRSSLKTDLAFIALEICICLVLAVVVLVILGSQRHLTLTPFTLSAIPQGGHFLLGVVLAILSFLGFEGAVTLGEETRSPRKNIPRAVLVSLLIVGVFFVLMAYIAVVGYGANNMGHFASDAAPFDTIARKFLGTGFAVLIDIAGIISLFALALAIINSGARIILSIGRAGLFPSWLARTHVKHKSPMNAILVLCLVTLVIGIPLGFLLTPIGAFGFLGTLDAVVALLIYALVCVACCKFFWAKRRERFNILRHAVLPSIAFIGITVILIGIVYPPGLAPLSLIPFIVIAWFMAGIVGLLYLQKRRPERIVQAGVLFIASNASDENMLEEKDLTVNGPESPAFSNR